VGYQHNIGIIIKVKYSLFKTAKKMKMSKCDVVQAMTFVGDMDK